jgi:hypothetical protein
MNKILKRRLLFGVCFFVSLFFCQISSAVTITGTCKDVGKNGTIQKCTYESTDTVVVGTPEIFKISVPRFYGHILEADFSADNASNTDIRIDEKDNQTVPDIYSVYKAEDFGDGIRPAMIPSFYINRDGEAYLYLRIDPQDNATSDWKQMLTIGQ